MITLIRFAAVVLGMIFFSTIYASAGDLTIPHQFNAGDPAVAAEVNENFTEVEAAVDDNDVRINTNLSYIDAVVNIISTQTISIPARALSYNPSSTIITIDSSGLLWQQDYASSAAVVIKAPADWVGDDVIFHIFFRTTTTTPGDVDFFIRPNSFNSGDDVSSSSSVGSLGVSVSGSPIGTYYQNSITIPADRLLGGDWWYNSIQREGSESTYTDDVVVYSVAFEYHSVLP